MMKEIGGYLGLEVFSGRAYYEDLVAVNSGRNGLLYLLKARKIQKLYIPAFLCNSVSCLCRRERYDYEEYPVGADFLPRFSGHLGEGEWLYVVNYYGQISDDQLRAIKEQYGNVIVDNVQAFFQKPVPGIDTVYSCRKFFGVPDGGYVATDAQPLVLQQDSSRDRMKHILGRFEETGSAFYRDFRENDERFYDLPLQKMSPLTQNLLRAVDYDLVRRKRNENYAVLAEALDGKNPLALKTPDGPYCYPFYCENGMEMKSRLAQKKIYVPTLWPNVCQYGSAMEKDYAQNILPLPCDQRYSPEDMLRMIAEVKKC